jgi:membrane-bound ClpP family serine protease
LLFDCRVNNTGTLFGVGITLIILVSHPHHPHPQTIVVIFMLLVLAVQRTMGQNYAITVLLSTPASLMLIELMSLYYVMALGLLTTRVQDIILGSRLALRAG